MRQKTKKSAKYLKNEMIDEDFNNKSSSIYKDMLTFKKVKLSAKQQQLFDLIINNKITVAIGPPGTAKTFSACYAALKLYHDNYCKNIFITKPTEIVGGTDLGFLPGTLNEKLAVYEESFMSNFSEIIEGRDLKMLKETKVIEYKPVQFVRGRTFNNAVVIIDEFQSFDIKSLMAIVTRLGKNNCKMIFIGDTEQNDINKKFVAVDFFLKVLEGIKDVATFKFDRQDIVRDKILIDIIDNYEKLKGEGELPMTKGNK